MPDDSRAADVHSDAEWDAQARDETSTERLDRNWADLLQEIRVVQTGVQFLTGFLLTLPFQQRFGALGQDEKIVYLCTVGASVTATALLQVPVSAHRALFRRHRRAATALLAHRLAMVGTALLGLALVGVVALRFDVVIDAAAGVLAASAAAAIVAALWADVPAGLRARSRSSKL